MNNVNVYIVTLIKYTQAKIHFDSKIQILESA